MDKGEHSIDREHSKGKHSIVEIGRYIFDKNFKVWIKIIKREVKWLRLGGANTHGDRGRLPWAIKFVKGETVSGIIAGAELGSKGLFVYGNLDPEESKSTSRRLREIQKDINWERNNN